MYKTLTNTSAKEPRKYHFAASKLSGNILKEYLSETLQNADEMKLFSGSIPKQYSESQDLLYEFNGLLRMSTMVVRDWKDRLSSEGLTTIYLDDDIVKDAKCFYEAWSTVHDETGNHIVQKHFFKMIYEICAELNDRGIVEVDKNGCTTMYDSDHIATPSSTAVTVNDIVERMQRFQMKLPESNVDTQSERSGHSSERISRPDITDQLSIKMEPLEPSNSTTFDYVHHNEQSQEQQPNQFHVDDNLGVSFDTDTENDDREEGESDNPSADNELPDPFDIY